MAPTAAQVLRRAKLDRAQKLAKARRHGGPRPGSKSRRRCGGAVPAQMWRLVPHCGLVPSGLGADAAHRLPACRRSHPFRRSVGVRRGLGRCALLVGSCRAQGRGHPRGKRVSGYHIPEHELPRHAVAHICAGIGLTAPTSAPGLDSTALPTSAPGLGSPHPHLRRDRALPLPTSAPGLGLTPCHIPCVPHVALPVHVCLLVCLLVCLFVCLPGVDRHRRRSVAVTSLPFTG